MLLWVVLTGGGMQGIRPFLTQGPSVSFFFNRAQLNFAVISAGYQTRRSLEASNSAKLHPGPRVAKYGNQGKAHTGTAHE